MVIFRSDDALFIPRASISAGNEELHQDIYYINQIVYIMFVGDTKKEDGID